MKDNSELEGIAEEIIGKYPDKRSASLPLLHIFQKKDGYIKEDAVKWIAQKLSIEPIKILELVTFYPVFRRKPAGKKHIRLCKTLSCQLAGSSEILNEICSKIKVKKDKISHHDPILNSDDGEYSVELVECLASCGSAPVCLVNDEFHENLDKEKIAKVLS